MAFRLYDTRQRALVDFEPLIPGRISIYNCGPTVYSTAHIGNFRSFMLADLLRRSFEWRGYQVTQIMNITDVGHLTQDDRADAQGEDKLQQKARELGWDPFRVARHFEQEFHEHRKALGIQCAHQYPRATDHIPDMLVQIQQLLDRGHAYVPEGTGEVYYDLSTFPEYGVLSGKDIEALQAGARVEVNSVKRHPGDFALWKTDSGHLMQWDPHDSETWKDYPGTRPALDPRIGRGFPGWHIECSAMAMRYLGQAFDVHTGGEDNIFPHHECEIAQATGATGAVFARHWMHGRHLLVNGAKMSKSAGTLYRLADILAEGYTPTELRYALLCNHYRQPMNFTFDGLKAARSSVQRLQNARNALAERAGGAAPSAPAGAEVRQRIDQFKQAFEAALDDDLNIATALAAVFALASDAHKLQTNASDAAHLLAALDHADHVTGVLEKQNTKSGLLTPESLLAVSVPGPQELEQLLADPGPINVEQLRVLAAARNSARKQKDFALADRLRQHLERLGVVLKDSPQGLRYTLP
jgi:cysteinyl-tRNA synthetase